MLRPVLQYPSPFLRQPTSLVTCCQSPHIQQLINDLCETMYATDGIGLAAIQVGAPERIFVVDSAVAGHASKEEPLIFVNPERVWASVEQETAIEGCLSFPGEQVAVKRPRHVRFQALDRWGAPLHSPGHSEIHAEGLFARVLQHEWDHLNNRLLYDYAGPIKQKKISTRLK
jgi:peptide deformylase